MAGADASIVAWSAAFWVAVRIFAARRDPSASGARFVAGLLLGALASHVVWIALHLPHVRAAPLLLADPFTGFSVLGLPLGVLAVAPWRAPLPRREAWLAAALGALPLAIATARLGCVAAGCCHGTVSALPWAIRSRHPTALYEVAGFALLHVAIARTPRAWVPGATLIGFGAVRLAVEPWRAPPPLGPPVVPPSVVAAAWLVAGLAFARRSWRTGARQSAPRRRFDS